MIYLLSIIRFRKEEKLMENKTKVKVAVVIGIIILAIVFILMVVFVKGNKTSVNNNIPRKGEEGYVDPTVKNTAEEPTSDNTVQELDPEEIQQSALDNVISIGIKGDYLVKINSDFTSSNIKKLEIGYSEYCYGDNKVYIVNSNQGVSNSVIEIDISQSNYPEKQIISTSDYGNIKNIEYYQGKLYFVTSIGQLVEYSISESYARAITNPNEVSSFVINKNRNVMYVSYKPEGTNAGIYVLDFTANTFTQIITLNDFAGELILSGNSLVIDVKEIGSLYVYDIVNNTANSIGSDNNLKSAESHVAFYGDIILYTDGTAINLKKENGEVNQDNWYVLNDSSIAGISMLNSSVLQLERYDEGGRNASNITRSVLINLKDGTTTEVPDTVYFDVVRIK